MLWLACVFEAFDQYTCSRCPCVAGAVQPPVLGASSRSCRHGCFDLSRNTASAGFTSLCALLLGSNRLDGWAAVDALNRFPALEEARLSDNPLTAAAPSSARYQCIARIRWVGRGH